MSAVAEIQVGGTIPAQSVKESAPDAATPLELKGKNIIVGVPGAFTGTCHAQVPGYIEAYDEFKAKGVNEIYIFAVNDVFVTKCVKPSLCSYHEPELIRWLRRAWKDNLAPSGSNVHFIADDNAAFANSVGLAFDATPVLGGHRSKRDDLQRYVIVTDDDKVSSIAVEADPGKLTITSAANVLAQL
ncbi:hypothetical protein DXG03_009681 [Asterophora parasitica]|uniref:Redoxin domain-containing protein n=1 Tax=Asterophora parasitica TaxID=117018 RepID=A0A9P7GAN8_9AGAR|nr:hypothetical protein DXG03_009681 [Asterophora parasitica]